ncbi:MAG: DMT family transporter [Gammaproteobacteria bacterium]
MAARSIHLKLVAAATFWALTPIFGRMLAIYQAPYALAFGRFVIATTALWLVLRMMPGAALTVRLSARDWRDFTLLGLTGIFLHNVLTLVAVEYVQANRANVIFASISMMIALIDIVLLRRLPPLLSMLGLVAGLAGTAIVVTDGRPALLLAGALGRGEWLVLGAAASWAAYSVLGRPLLERYSPLVVTYHASLCGTLLLLPCVLLDADVLGALLRDPAVWGMTVFAGCISSALGFLWFYQGVDQLGAMRTSAYINLVPIFGVLLAALILGEQATMALVAGGALVIAGLVLLNRAPVPRNS